MQLTSLLVREGQKVTRLHLGQFRARKSAKWRDRGKGSSTEGRRVFVKRSKDIEGWRFLTKIDQPMLNDLRKVFRGDASPDPNDVLETIWDGLREKICEDYDLCAKLHRTGLFLDLMQLAVYGVPDVYHKIIVAALILGFRRGPKWMCNCD